MSNPLLIIRADASGAIGSGHVSRTLCLAAEWKSLGGRVLLLATEITEPLIQRASESGVQISIRQVERGSSQDIHFALEFAADASAIVVDGYCFDEEYQKSLCCPERPLLVLDDDPGLRRFYCDYLLNPNLYATEALYIDLLSSTDTQLLLGSEFALLSRGFAMMRECQRSFSSPDNLIVSLGGGNTTAATQRILSAMELIESHRLNIAAIVPGADYADFGPIIRRSHHRIQLVLDYILDMPRRIYEADIGIISGGTTSWEALCLGLPSVVVSVADNQVLSSAEIDRRRGADYAGRLEAVTTVALAEMVKLLIENDDYRRQLSGNAMSLVDAGGAARVANLLWDRALGSSRQPI